jgi:hypothetical protein
MNQKLEKAAMWNDRERGYASPCCRVVLFLRLPSFSGRCKKSWIADINRQHPCNVFGIIWMNGAKKHQARHFEEEN